MPFYQCIKCNRIFFNSVDVKRRKRGTDLTCPFCKSRFKKDKVKKYYTYESSGVYTVYEKVGRKFVKVGRVKGIGNLRRLV